MLLRAAMPVRHDIAPARETLEHYRAQVLSYLDMTRAERGIIVLATSGTVIPVGRASPAVAAA